MHATLVLGYAQILERKSAYYFNARWYDPELGRFITEDPIRDGENWYGYVRNNPLRYTDPSGLYDWEQLKADAAASFNMDYGEDFFQQSLAQFKSGDILGGLGSGLAGLCEMGYETAGAAIFDTALDGAEAVTRSAQGDNVGATIAVGSMLVPEAVEGVLKSGRGILKASESTSDIVHSSPFSKVKAVITETITSKEKNITSQHTLSVDELLEAGEEFLGPNYSEIGKAGSGVFRNGERQFRIDSGSITGSHNPGIPHGHLEIYKEGSTKPIVNNHIPFVE